MHTPKPTLQISPLMQLQNRITARDDRLLGWLYDHGVLTTDQIAKALFTSKDFAQRRMLRPTDLKAVTRFRPNKPDGGSYPYHYVLEQLGYVHVMGQRDLGLPRRDQARRMQQSLIRRPDLPHLLGGNQFFTDLAAYEQTHPGTSLARWWPAAGSPPRRTGVICNAPATQTTLAKDQSRMSSLTWRIRAESAVPPGHTQTRTGIPSRVTAIPTTTWGRSSRESLLLP